MMDAWLCKTCGHEDVDRDPKTREVLSPTHIILEVAKAVYMTDAVPKHLISPRGTADFCLICNTICVGSYSYEVVP